jgi:hypothetical protein
MAFPVVAFAAVPMADPVLDLSDLILPSRRKAEHLVCGEG